MRLGTQNSLYQQKIDKWIGRSSADLYAVWGMPMQTTQFDADTILATYYQSESQPIDNVFEPYESEMSYDAMAVPDYCLPPAPPLFYCKTTFVIRNGIVSNADFNGDDCY
jgi:hypothetical protein